MSSSSNNTITTTTITSSFPKYPYPTEFNVVHFVPKDLSETNYNEWNKMMLDFIRSQGLIGFIDGTVRAPANSVDSVASPSDVVVDASSIQEYYTSWKRTDNLVRGWILTTLTVDIRLKVLAHETAKDVWMKLRKMFDQPAVLNQPDEERDSRQAQYPALRMAVIKGDWDIAIRIIIQDPDAISARITPTLETTLIVAVYMPSSVRRLHFVRKLLEKMSPESVALCDSDGRTALHVAATVGDFDVAEMLVYKNPDLPNIFDKYGSTPFGSAAASGNGKIVHYLMPITSEDVILREDQGGAELRRNLVKSEFYDIALDLLQRKPQLLEPTLFDIIMDNHYSFPSGTSLNFWQNLVYWGVPIKSESITNRHRGGGEDIENPTNCCISVRQRMSFMLWNVVEKLVPQIKYIRKKKTIHHNALELIKFLIIEVTKSKNISQVESIFNSTLYKATYVGIPEIVEEIIGSYPAAMAFTNWNDRNILLYAIVWRRERVFNLIYQVGYATRYIALHDGSGNNGLHLAGCLGHQQQNNLRAGAAGAVLQMQRELQWFKEVEKFSMPRNRNKRNVDGMTPAEVFTETHQELRKEGERWMKDTATSCTIVAALIATMVFAAAITVPGGNDNVNGYPLLSKRKAFIIFGISDAVALFSSITSVLMFLLILTSRYSEADFLQILPKRLVTGLVTLFLSILSMMVAFGAILYLVFGDNKTWVLIPVVALASIPVTLFGALQFPLLVEMIQSTYGRGIFGKQSDRILG